MEQPLEERPLVLVKPLEQVRLSARPARRALQAKSVLLCEE